MVLVAGAVAGTALADAHSTSRDVGGAPAGAANARSFSQAEPTPTPRSVVFTVATVEPTATEEPEGDGNTDTFTLPTAEPTVAAEESDQPASDDGLGGTLAYAARVGGQWDIYSLDIDTGESTQLTSSPSDEIAPAWSPDGTQLVFMSGQSGSQQVWVMNRDGSDQRQVTQWTGSGQLFYTTWLPDGNDLIVTVADNAAGVAWLIRQPVDGGAATGYTEPWSGVASVAADSGAMAYTVRTSGQTDIVLDDGSPRPITATGVSEDIPSITRDGTSIVYQVGDPGGRYVEIHDVDTGTTTRLPQIGDDSNPVWSPDGERIAFVSEDGVWARIFVTDADGSNTTELPTVEYETAWYLSWAA
jgi:Tol biopolymer transport system component